MNIKSITYYICFFIVFYCNSQSNIGIINDPDGYVNIRLRKNSKSVILGKIKTDEYFSYFPNDTSNWWSVETSTGLVGYVHKSRIKPTQKGYIHNGKIFEDSVGMNFNEYKFKHFIIQIIQLKPEGQFYYYNCKAYIRILKDNRVVNKLRFEEIDAVGGDYGILVNKKQPSNSLFVLSKFGDYDGQIIIINSEGKITTFNGGSYFTTNNNKYLISTWDSDLSGLSIYDLENKKLVFEEELEEYLGNWYVNNDKYYATIWNGDKEIDKAYQIDFNNYKLVLGELKKSDGQKIEWINNGCSCY